MRRWKDFAGHSQLDWESGAQSKQQVDNSSEVARKNVERTFMSAKAHLKARATRDVLSPCALCEIEITGFRESPKDGKVLRVIPNLIGNLARNRNNKEITFQKSRRKM